MAFLQQTFSNVLRRRALNINNLDTELHRCLSTFDLTMVGTSYTLGIGLFVLIGTVAKTMAGPAVIFSIIITAVCALFSALCYAEFGCRVPKAGSAYLYAYVTVGEIWAFVIGWNMILEYIGCAAGVSSGFAATIGDTFDGLIHNLTVEYLMDGHPWQSLYIAKYPDLLAGLLIIVFTTVLLYGAEISSKLNKVLVGSLLVVLMILIVYSLKFANLSNWTDNGGFFPFGMKGVFEGAAQLFFLFAGFEVICTSSEECTNPIKSIPIALILTIVINAVFGVLSAICLTLMVPWAEIDQKAPFPGAFRRYHETFPTYLVTTGILITISGTILNALFGLSRLIYAISSDGLLFLFLRSLSQNRVPTKTILTIGAFSFVLAVFLNFHTLIQLLNIGSIVSYLIIATLLIVIRYRPEEDNNIFYRVENAEEWKHDKTESDVIGGTLKTQFKCLSFLDSETPGKIVVISLAVFISCCGCLIFIMFNTNQSWGVFHIALAVGACLSICVILLHNQNQENPPFKVPLVPFIPVLSIICNLFLLANLSAFTWIRFLVWVIIGLLIYAMYGYHNSIMIPKECDDPQSDSPLLAAPNGDENPDFGTMELSEISAQDK
ncbi:cationic amino acid transporter 4-like [Antedon mediterranea]|uniref:cationic amino acid transporter 4-like n=1 Tax=Antedon mediterranea TaxID=105859 RepID=UPI003AF40DD5